jgi:hypothetical protein
MPRLRPHPVETKKSVSSWATAFLRNHGSTGTIRFECEPGVGLPELLSGLGFSLRKISVADAAEVYEIEL